MHWFSINDHVDSISEISKKHYQYLQENVCPQKKNSFFSVWYTAGTHQKFWYVVSLWLFWDTNGIWESQKWLQLKILACKLLCMEIWFISSIWQKTSNVKLYNNIFCYVGCCWGVMSENSHWKLGLNLSQLIGSMLPWSQFPLLHHFYHLNQNLYQNQPWNLFRCILEVLGE